MSKPSQLIPALWLLATYRLGRSEHAEVDKFDERLHCPGSKVHPSQRLTTESTGSSIMGRSWWEGQPAGLRERLGIEELSKTAGFI